MPPSHYRKRVETVDAIQYTGDNKNEVIEFAPGIVVENPDGTLQISPGPGISFVLEVGMWVLKDIGGLYSPMSEGLFELYYQPGGP